MSRWHVLEDDSMTDGCEACTCQADQVHKLHENNNPNESSCTCIKFTHTHEHTHLFKHYKLMCVFIEFECPNSPPPSSKHSIVMNIIVLSGVASVTVKSHCARFCSTRCCCKFLTNLTLGQPLGTTSTMMLAHGVMI